MEAYYNKELEIKVIGLILVHPDLYKKYEIEEKLFFTTEAVNLFRIIKTLSDESKSFDDLELLKSYGADIEFVKQCMQTDSFSKSHFVQDYNELNRLAVYRTAIKKIDEMRKLAEQMPRDVEDFFIKSDRMMMDILEEFNAEKSPYIKDILERLEENREEYRKDPNIGTKSGFDIIDNLTGGLLPRNIWICGANSSTGKTFFALQIILNALKQKKKCLLFSLEMSDIMNTARMVGNVSGHGALEIFQGANNEIISDSFDWMKKQELIIYDNKMKLDTIRNISKKHHMLGGIDLIVIDYIQNVEEEGSGYETMSKAARVANMIAQETKSSVLLISQISQDEARRTKKGGIVTYKGAGELTAAPDVGLFLERLIDENDEVIPDRLLCRIAKNRHGSLGRLFLKADLSCGFIKQDIKQDL